MVLVAAAVLVAGLALWLLTGCAGSVTAQRLTQSPDTRANAAARRFLARYVTPDGRVVRIDQGGDTVGEGQAYGMLMAAAIGDARRFDSIWNWTKANLRRPDGLISFRWQNGRILDPQAASDVDLDASRALLVAACRFHRPELRQEAIALGKSILGVEVTSFQGAPVLTAGPWAVTAPVTINPSYFAPATFAALRSASGDPRWQQLADSARALTSDLMPAPSRLPPDWARLEGTAPVPIGNPSAPGTPGQFSFDAVRTLVRMAEDPNPRGAQIAARAWPAFENANPTKLPVQHDLHGRPIGDVLNPVVLVAAAGAADAAGHPAARDGLLDAAETLNRRFPTYFGAAWVALGRLMLTTKLLAPCTS
jgi:endoglucanase